jgi:hypothetical protein
MDKKLSFPDFKESVSDEIDKAKTNIGSYAGEKSYYRNVLNKKKTLEEKLEGVKSARDEADSEFQRETTRGIRPKGMKTGGKVSSASKRADGCAIRGKTRA